MPKSDLIKCYRIKDQYNDLIKTDAQKIKETKECWTRVIIDNYPKIIDDLNYRTYIYQTLKALGILDLAKELGINHLMNTEYDYFK